MSVMRGKSAQYALDEVQRGGQKKDFFETPLGYMNRLAEQGRQRAARKAGDQLAADAYNKRADLRDQAIEAKMLGASLAEDAVLDQERLGEENLQAINTRTGQAFALGVDPYGMGAGGGGIAAMGDLAQQAALSQIEQRQANANLLRQVRQRASDTRAAAAEYAATAGSRESDYAATMAEATAKIQDAMGGIFNSDKRRAVRSAIAAARASNPKVADDLEVQYREFA